MVGGGSREKRKEEEVAVEEGEGGVKGGGEHTFSWSFPCLSVR